MSYWNELLRNGEGVRYRGGRESISDWLLGALEGDLPYDRFVSKLLNPSGEDDPKGFLIGVNWRGATPAHQKPMLQAFRTAGFLGTEYGPFTVLDPREATTAVRPPEGVGGHRFHRRY